MQLGMAAEADLLLKYTPLAKRLIRNYCNACNLDVSVLGDDLLQEAYVEMLLHIQNIHTEQEIPLVKLDILGAIYNALRRMAVVSIPKHAYKQYRNMFRSEPYEESLLGADPSTEDDLVFMATFNGFLEGLNEQERLIIEKKMENYTHQELVSRMGVPNKMTVTRTLQKLRKELGALLTVV